MSSPFQPIKAQATTGRPVKGLTSMPSISAVEPMQAPSMKSSSPKPSMGGSTKSMAQPTPNKQAGAYTHETRGGSAPSGMTQGITGHNTVPHLSMH